MPSYVKEPGTSDRMEFQIVDRQMIINQLEAIKILESTIRNEVIEAQVWGCLNEQCTGSIFIQESMDWIEY